MLPEKQGLYSPENEHDNCGAGFICSLQGKKTNDIIHKALDILVKFGTSRCGKCRWKNWRWSRYIDRNTS